MIYIPDTTIHDILTLNLNKQTFIKEAIEEKLEKVEKNESKIL